MTGSTAEAKPVMKQSSSRHAHQAKDRQLNHTRNLPPSDREIQHDQASAALPIIHRKYSNIADILQISLVQLHADIHTALEPEPLSPGNHTTKIVCYKKNVMLTLIILPDA